MSGIYAELRSSIGFTEWDAISERVIILRSTVPFRNLVVINIYAHTNEKQNKIKAFLSNYNQYVKPGKVNIKVTMIVIGYANAKVEIEITEEKLFWGSK